MRKSNYLLCGLGVLLGLTGCGGTAPAPATESISYRYDSLPDAGEGSTAAAEFRALSKWSKLNLTYFFVNGTSKLPGNTEQELVREAFAVWAAQTPLTFTETTNRAAADIEIGWAEGEHGDEDAFDGPGNVLAHATFPNPFTDQVVYLHFDNSERWANSPTEDVDVLSVAIHEIGHVLGLGHSRDTRAVMYASYTGPHRTLSADDVAGVQELYGATSSAEPPTAPPPSATVPPTTRTDTDKDGLSDAEEVYVVGTDPRKLDTDGDGLGDGLELLYRMNPLDPDMDKDGVSDGAEIQAGTNPFFPDQQTAASPELLQQVSTYLGKAIEAEIDALRQGDAALASHVFAADVLTGLQSQVAVLNQQGWVQVSAFDYYNSYIDDVRVITQREIEVDTCEVWSTAVYDKTTGQLVRSTEAQLTPQTITLRQLDIGWFITAVDFLDAPAFCN